MEVVRYLGLVRDDSMADAAAGMPVPMRVQHQTQQRQAQAQAQPQATPRGLLAQAATAPSRGPLRPAEQQAETAPPYTQPAAALPPPYVQPTAPQPLACAQPPPYTQPDATLTARLVRSGLAGDGLAGGGLAGGGSFGGGGAERGSEGGFGVGGEGNGGGGFGNGPPPAHQPRRPNGNAARPPKRPVQLGDSSESDTDSSNSDGELTVKRTRRRAQPRHVPNQAERAAGAMRESSDHSRRVKR